MPPKLRMFAGPNGSGKSTLARMLSIHHAVNLYTFINADNLLAEISKSNYVACPFPMDNSELLAFIAQTTYQAQYKALFEVGKIRINDDDIICFEPGSANPYSVAIVADYFKDQYLKRKLSFSFETVFSHPSKIELLKQAQSQGFKTYMYFIATNDPAINVNRIKNRVRLGGHDVPEDKTFFRYERCLKQVQEAIPLVEKVYFFDNSIDTVFLAEYETGVGFTLHSNDQPDWFKKYVFEE